MTKFYEGRWPTEGVIHEEEMAYSRETVTIASGAGKLSPGMVLGKITASGKYVPSPATGTDGSETATAILLYPVDATSADQTAVVLARVASFNKNVLSFDASVDTAPEIQAKRDQLKAVGIITE